MLRSIFRQAFLVAVFSSLLPADEITHEVRERGRKHLETLTALPWLAEWKAATIQEIRWVAQKPDLSFKTGLAPVWYARLKGPKEAVGYLMWETEENGRLIEFSVDAPLKIKTPEAASLAGVPPIQQFALPEDDGTEIASGCVPTSAASVVAFWIQNGTPKWRGDLKNDLEKGLAKRLRSRLKMQRFPDTDGFTENGMALAGALPVEMAKALQSDADDLGVPIESRFHRFSWDLLRTEIAAGRPVLLSCTVRVPHKPELSWGHEVAGIAWATIDGDSFVGFQDNYFPTKSPEAIRWVRTPAFHSLITIKPAPENPQD